MGGEWGRSWFVLHILVAWTRKRKASVLGCANSLSVRAQAKHERAVSVGGPGGGEGGGCVGDSLLKTTMQIAACTSNHNLYYLCICISQPTQSLESVACSMGNDRHHITHTNTGPIPPLTPPITHFPLFPPYLCFVLKRHLLR